MGREKPKKAPEKDVDRLGTTPLMRAAAARDATQLIDMVASGNFRASLFVKDDKVSDINTSIGASSVVILLT